MRERLLAAADELFYAEGVHTVGIDRVIERAGVSKASLYGIFGSKDELVRAYLEGRAVYRETRIAARVAERDEPRAKILAVFEFLADRAEEPNFRGCAFLNATAEGPIHNSTTRDVALGTRAWLRELFENLAGELGVADPAEVSRKLALLYDGAMIAASLERDRDVVRAACDLAREVVDAAPREKPRRKPRASVDRPS